MPSGRSAGDHVTAFLPCRAGSERVPHKNIRPFGNRSDGLIGIKLDQLLSCEMIDRIILSTNDPVILAIGRERAVASEGRLVVDQRPEELCASSTSTDDLVKYVPTKISAGHVLWTHVTSPLFDQAQYADVIARYFEAVASGGHDSLVSVTRLNAFLWSGGRPLNYDRNIEKWPRTQTLNPVFEINNAAFVAPIDTYRSLADRIGVAPLLYEVKKELAWDIDDVSDFAIAEGLWRNFHDGEDLD